MSPREKISAAGWKARRIWGKTLLKERERKVCQGEIQGNGEWSNGQGKKERKATAMAEAQRRGRRRRHAFAWSAKIQRRHKRRINRHDSNLAKCDRVRLYGCNS